MNRHVPVRAALALFATLALACGGDAPVGPVRLSILAVGDTGARPSDDEDYPRMRRVAHAMERQDHRRPVHALVLLGDNFYDDGLRAVELAARVRANLVVPFCRFLALDGSRSDEVSDACRLPPADRHPVPVYAVLGNHDYASEESPALQREVVSEFVSNWRMDSGPVAVVEFEAGLSVVLVDSERVADGDGAEPVRRALRRSQGPWRIVASHRPLFSLGGGGRDADEVERENTYVERMRDAIERSGVPVHLFVSGHEHNLQVLRQRPGPAALHIVAGGGSDAKKLRTRNPHRLFGLETRGFARIDLVGEEPDARLVATLYRLPPAPLDLLPASGWPVSRWTIGLAGDTAPD